MSGALIAVYRNLRSFGAALSILSINTSQQELNLRTWALSNGWDGASPVEITLASGVYIWSNNTSNAALVVDGSWPGGLTLTNNGFIMGKGGVGESTGDYLLPNTPPGAGGPAMSLGVSFSMVNNGSLGGGGGGGGGIRDRSPGGGGAGGGAGGATRYYNSPTPGGAIGQKGTNGQDDNPANPYYLAGGAGGRIMPGLATVDAGGSAQLGGDAGGQGCWYLWSNGDPYPHEITIFGSGGQGGGGGNPGSIPAAEPSLGSGAGGGGWGASGGQAGVGGGWPAGQGAPGLGGKAVNLNGFTLTKTGAGPVYGVIS